MVLRRLGLAVWLLSTMAMAQVPRPDGVAVRRWSAEDGLPQNTVSGVAMAPDGYLWVATYGGLARFDGSRFEVFDVGNRSDLSASRFRKLFVGRAGAVWSAQPGVGVVRYQGDRFQYFDVPTPVDTFAEDSRGVLWVTARGGLWRFDGAGFDLVLPDHAYGLGTTSDGSVWASSREGLSRWSEGRVEALAGERGLPDTVAWAVFEDSLGRLWVGWEGGLLRAEDVSGEQFVPIEGAPSRIYALAESETGLLWLSGRHGLHRLDTESGRVEKVDVGSAHVLHSDSRGTIWRGVLGGGLVSYRTSPISDGNRLIDLPKQDVYSCTIGADGAVVVGGESDARILRGRAVEVRNFGEPLMAFLATRDGGRWFGIRDRLRYERGDVVVEIPFDHAAHSNPRSFLELSDGRVLLGTAKRVFEVREQRLEPWPSASLDGVTLFEEAPGIVWVGGLHGLTRVAGDERTTWTAEEGLSPGMIRTLHLDERGVLWAGSYGGGLSRIEGEEVTRFNRHNGLANDFVSAIVPDDGGRFWLNTNAGPVVVRRADLDAVARGDRVSIRCVSFSAEEGAREANGGFQNGGFRAADGRIWFPTIKGVSLLDPARLPVDEAPPRPALQSLILTEARRLDVRFTALGWSAPERVRLQYRLLDRESGWVDADRSRQVTYLSLPPGTHRFQVRARNGYGPWSDVLEETVTVRPHFQETAWFLSAVVLVTAAGVFWLGRVQLRRARARSLRLQQLLEDREAAHRSLARSQASLTRLSRELLSAQELERRRISSELHDDVTQRIAALALQADLVEGQLAEADEGSRAQVGEIARMAQQLAGDVQQLSRRLHPLGLRSLGLCEAVRRECEAFERRGGVAVDLADELDGRDLADEVSIATFRVLQESLHNIEKHAQASVVEVGLFEIDGALHLAVSDRGRGFQSSAEDVSGLGLITMQERAASIGGRVRIESTPGAGTRVELVVPLERNMA